MGTPEGTPKGTETSRRMENREPYGKRHNRKKGIYQKLF